jgi:hypothetical protein
MIEGILALDHADEASGVPKPLGYLVPRQNAKLRARLHPAAIAGVWAWQAAFALIAAYPAASLVGAVYGNDPRGDLPLGAAGAHALLDFLRLEQHGLAGAGGGAAIVLVAATFAGLIPLAALMTAMAHATHGGHRIGAARAVGGAMDALPALGALFVAVGAAEFLATALAAGVGQIAEGSTRAWLGEARGQMVGVASAALAFIPAMAIGVVHDLARAAVIRLKLGTLRACVAGFRAFREAPVTLGWSWGWRGLVGFAPIALVAPVADRLATRGGVALVALALLHQAVVLVRVALRASWLAKALRTVDLSHG